MDEDNGALEEIEAPDARKGDFGCSSMHAMRSSFQPALRGTGVLR